MARDGKRSGGGGNELMDWEGTGQNGNDIYDEDYVREEEEGKTSIHPLLIEHVAKCVFGFLGWRYTPEILACRKVCWAWCDIITNRVKQEGTARKFTFQRCASHQVDLFVKEMTHTKNLPFDTFEFEEHFFIRRNTQIFSDFLEVCGNFIVHLSLKFGKHYTADISRMKINYSQMSLNCLRRLSFKCVEMETWSDFPLTSTSCTWLPQFPFCQLDGLSTLFGEILNNAYNLEYLEFILPPKYFDGEFAKLANTKFVNILTTSLPETVISLKLFMEIGDELLSGLARLELKSLDIEFYGKQVSQEAFQIFFTRQQKSLKSLRIMDYDSVYCDNSFSFARFNQIKTFQVKKTGSSLSYLESFPNVQSLILLNGGEHKASTDDVPKKYKCSTITSLEFQFPILCPNFVKMCVDCLTNVTTLRVQATPESTRAIQKIFELMTNLKELKISFTEPFKRQPVDPLLTGFSSYLCNTIREETILRRVDQNLIPDLATRKPSLINLSNLQKLEIESEFQSISLTNITVQYALLHIPFLEEVVLLVDHEISSKWLEVLRQRLILKEMGKSNQDGASESEIAPADRLALVPLAI